MIEMNNLKITANLSEKEKNEIMSVYHLCNATDSEHYDFSFDDDARYYLYYNNNSMISVVSLIPYEEGYCLYGFVHPNFRRKHIMTNLIKFITDELCNPNMLHSQNDHHPDAPAPVSLIQVHIPDHKGNTTDELLIPKHIHTLLSNTGFSFSHHEYLMEFLFDNLSEIDDCIHSTYLSNSSVFPEPEFDEEENEYSLWLGETYIGGCFIMPFYEDNYVTFYDFEIISEFRSKGFGRAGLSAILHDLKNKRFEKLILHVSGENKIAHNLYMSCGLTVHSSLSVYKKFI